MNINDAFPSDLLKAEDLQGRNVCVIIDKVELKDIGQGEKKDRKLVLHLRGKTKKLVCNKTNANTIGKHYGPMTENWIGQPITIGPREVEFQGNIVWAIRVSLTKPEMPRAGGNIAPPPPPPPPQDTNMDDPPF